MRVVLDSSVVVAALVDSGSRGLWAEQIMEEGVLHAPELVRVEVTNVLRRLELTRQITTAEANAAQDAMAESFFATLEREVIDRHRFHSQIQARMAVFTWIESWYNPHRRHSSLGYRSPMNYERQALGHQSNESLRQNPALLPLTRQTALRAYT